MIIWSIAGSFFLFRYIFKDFSADMRFLLIGSIFPIIFNFLISIFGLSNEILNLSQSLITVLIIFSFVMIFTKRNTILRKNCLLICIGIFFCLLLNFIWLNQTIFFYPIPVSQLETFNLSSSSEIFLNIIGVFYLVSKLQSRQLIVLFLKTGKII